MRATPPIAAVAPYSPRSLPVRRLPPWRHRLCAALDSGRGERKEASDNAEVIGRASTKGNPEELSWTFVCDESAIVGKMLTIGEHYNMYKREGEK